MNWEKDLTQNGIDLFGHTLERKTLIAINKYFRANDESNLWPINGKFNVTDRAIRAIREFVPYADCGYSYASALENKISEIVNDSHNWG